MGNSLQDEIDKWAVANGKLPPSEGTPITSGPPAQNVDPTNLSPATKALTARLNPNAPVVPPGVDPELVQQLGYLHTPMTPATLDASAVATGKLSPQIAHLKPGETPLTPSEQFVQDQGSFNARPTVAPRLSQADVAKMQAQDAGPTGAITGNAGPAAPPLNPFANQQAAQQGQRVALQGEQDALTLAAEKRKGALGEQAESARGYAVTVSDKAAEANQERARLDKEHDALLQSETSRDFLKEYYDKKTPFQHFARVMAAAAGGFVQGWNHQSTNTTLQMLNEQADAAVKQAQSQSALKIQHGASLYEHFKDKTRDDAAATGLVHASLMDGLRTKLEEAGAESKDAQEHGRLAEMVSQIDMQSAAWKDAAAIARAKASAGAGPMSAQQLVALQKQIADTKKTEAETAAIEGKQAGGAEPVNAAAAQVENGPQLGPLDKLVAPYAADSGMARLFLGEGGTQANANLDRLAAAQMHAENLPLRGNAREDFKKARGYYTHPGQATTNARKVAKNPLIAEAEAKGAADYGGEEP